MNRKKIKVAFFISIIILIALLFTMFSLALAEGTVRDTQDYKTPLDFSGTCSIQGSEELEFGSLQELDLESVERVMLTGRFSHSIPEDKYLILAVSEAWIELECEGKTLGNNYNDFGKKTDTPGISYIFIPGYQIPEDKDITITCANPYAIDHSLTPIEDSLSTACYGDKDAPYIELLRECTVSVAVSLAICFLGLFAFNLAGLLWKKIQLRNLSVAFLAVTGGIFALTDTLRMYLPLWIKNPVLCLMLDEFTMFLLPVAAFLYIRQFMTAELTKKLMNIVTGASILLSATAFLLQIFSVRDILMSQFYVMIFIYAGIAGVVFSLIYEGFILKSRSVKRLFLTLTPLIFATIFDATNVWLAFAPGKSTLRLGLLFTISAQLYFLIVETIRHNKEATEYEKLQHELLQMRVAIMVSQIQPHFLYNSLTSIAQLCEKNPSAAKKATIEFADYMRHNMNSLKDEKPVPFEKELSHLETYLRLEKMRFGDELEIILDIKVTDFLIPSLAIQPLVENAVKHGVGMKEDGGTVKIATEEQEDCYKITVSDNGVGFDPSEKKNDGRIHVGMENVRNRLKTMCNATIDITSAVGEGTTVIIKIPKEEEQ